MFFLGSELVTISQDRLEYAVVIKKWQNIRGLIEYTCIAQSRQVPFWFQYPCSSVMIRIIPYVCLIL